MSLHAIEPEAKSRNESSFRKITVCVSNVALDFQEDKLHIANWSVPLEMKFQLNGQMPSLRK